MLSKLTVLLVATTAIVVQSAAPPPPANPALDKLIKKYGTIRNATCASVLSKVPTVDATDEANFMTAYQQYLGNNSEATVIAAAQKILSLPAVDQFLSLPDTSTAGGFDASMIKCALMWDALRGSGGSPKSELDGTMNMKAPAPSTPVPNQNLLAEFAVQGAAQEQLVDDLLANPEIMRDMMVAGGAVGGYYGQAFAIWTNISKSSPELAAALPQAVSMPWDDRTPACVLKRLAVGIAVTTAMGIEHRNSASESNATKFVDPVARYHHFASHYQLGDLDPAFPILTAFELSHAMDADANDFEFDWLRQTLANYRPDDIAISYHWRYAESVHSEVAYGDSQCPHYPGVCTGLYSDIPVGGDVCGGRAFWGRFSRKGFGVPTWGATEHAHAAMSSWTPNGWNVMLGAPWPDCWWGNRGGEDWYLETQARFNETEFVKILRGGWVANANGEDPVDGKWSVGGYNPSNGKGGFWSALTLYKKKIVAAASPMPNVTIPAAQPSIVNKVDALLAKFKAGPTPPPPPSTAADGTITISATAFSSKNRSAPVSVLPSADEGQQLLHNGCTSSVGPPCFEPASSSLTYNVSSANGGTYYLTTNFTTYHMNQDMNVSVNGAESVAVGVFYTLGWWNESQPVEITLVKGSNTLVFTRTSGRTVMYKSFILATTKPIVPHPNGNYTPIPAPPSPPPGSYIEVPADTTCVKQGITPVNADDCSHACLALGFKSTGPRARPNMSGCFVMSTGIYAGNCNFNTNTSATCTPPCTLYGSITRALCTRT